MSEANRLYLASSSPRRHALMRLANYRFLHLLVDVDETPRMGENPEALVLRLSQEKARSSQSSRRTSGLVVAADTLVVDDEGILGKPAGAEAAAAMLRRLRGKTHRVLTGLTVLDLATSRENSRVITSLVTMHAYSTADIAAYIASGSPLDKAGAYGIQDQAYPIVADVAGCYANVMGLPVCILTEILAQYGLLPYAANPVAYCAPARSCCAFGSVQTGI
ncbi:MAG: septum formation protein Maf [Chloroflexi bacterium]|nr:septum formation protein Maf [Chloroflexota bacterium]